MADLFTPLTWNDGPGGGTPATVARGPNRWEAGLEALDLEVDRLSDKVDAVDDITPGRIPTGPTAERGSPSLGKIFFDETLGYVIFGNGAAWVKADGTAVTGAGGANAPKNLAVTKDASDVFTFTWSAVGSATSYKLYETESPTGVSGKTALTGTTTTYSPGTARTYVFWLTATVSGTESAISNKVTVTIAATDGGTASPSGVLNINGIDGGTGGWWNLGIGFHAGDPEGSAHKDIEPTPLKTYNRSPYYTLNSGGTGVKFRVYLDGGRTSTNTKYPRSELREYKNSSTKASWNGASGTHLMSGKTKVLATGPDKREMVIAQMHDAEDDTLQIRCEGASGSAVWRASINGTEHATDLLTSYTYGTEVAWEIKTVNGQLTIKINGVTKITTTPGYGSGQYYKVGTYAQQNNRDQANSASDYAESELRDLVVTHTPAL